MTTVVLVAGERHTLSAGDLYASFGSRGPGGATAGAGGWLLDVDCAVVRPGAPVSARIPLGEDGPVVLLLGRISACVPGRRITVVHDQPWRGRLQLHFTDEVSDGVPGCRLRVTADLDEAGLAWWMEQRGWRDDRAPAADVHRIGLLTSKTGPGAVFAQACEYLARLAVDRVNAEGGLAGRRLEVVVHDDATDPGRAAVEARRMVQDGCRAIIGSVTSASFEAVRRAVADTGIPLIHGVLNEGGAGEDNVFRWGERPLAQMRAATRHLRPAEVGHRWHLIGNDYSWSHGAHAASRRAVDEIGGEVVTSILTPLGTTDFAEAIERLQRSDARVVVSSLVGADEVAFERQMWRSGLRERCTVVSLVMDESTREHIGDEAAAGIWTALGYFDGLETEANVALRRTYREQYGAWAPPLSSLSEGVYEAILLYAAAVRRSGGEGGSEVVRELRAVGGDLPRGRVLAAGPHAMAQQIHVARSVPGGFRIAGA
ncbi:substrate-binding protein [Nocardioides zeae]|uniref:Urea transport system substrate-binding protein n=1 Tax=Nocardioides zeae TaxID=1457234 RepID=A0AAJ1X3I1_9ACTN|nr:substrate-binding protein [Nocardioides zeae]MDQ1106414.1 urea transport system substrate-binding protein [Nocardioides zeae]